MRRRPPPVWRFVAWTLVILAVASASFVSGAALDRAAVLPGSALREPANVADTFSVFWQAWDLVQERYVDRTAIKPTEMTYGAIDGMLNSLGDVGHTRFLTPQELQAEEQALSGQLEGIGAEVTTRDGRPTIVAPIPGSPAQQAGLRPGDVIVRVDGKEVANLTLEQVVNLVRGPAGTSVTLTVLHKGETTLTDVTVVRARLTVPSVTWALLPGTTVAHILVSQFAQHATSQLVAAVKDARAAGARAFLLDLRNDPGGLRDEAIGVASQFLSDGNVLLERNAQGQETPYPVRPGGVAIHDPLVLLVNEGTASSAEIVAGAIQDHRRATLVGTTTFGTGTVLSTYRLRDGSAILLGTAEWLTPNGHQIWHHGIKPDVEVTLPPSAVPLVPAEEGSLTPAQLQASSDTQLLRALQEVQRVPAR